MTRFFDLRRWASGVWAAMCGRRSLPNVVVTRNDGGIRFFEAGDEVPADIEHLEASAYPRNAFDMVFEVRVMAVRGRSGWVLYPLQDPGEGSVIGIWYGGERDRKHHLKGGVSVTGGPTYFRPPLVDDGWRR